MNTGGVQFVDKKPDHAHDDLGLAFHPKAFSMVWPMPRLSPRQHVTAFRRLITAWHFEAHGWRAVFRSGGCE